MKTSEYLDAVRAKIGAPSDYALQKPLGLSKQQLSKYRKDLDFFSDEVAIRVAGILGTKPEMVMIDMHRERAKTPETRQFWQSIAENFIRLVCLADLGPRDTLA